MIRRRTYLKRYTPLRRSRKPILRDARTAEEKRKDAEWKAKVLETTGYRCALWATMCQSACVVRGQSITHYFVRCGGPLDPHHVDGKSTKDRRYGRGLPLCRKHHDWAHDHPAAFKSWLNESPQSPLPKGSTMPAKAYLKSKTKKELERENGQMLAHLQHLGPYAERMMRTCHDILRLVRRKQKDLRLIVLGCGPVQLHEVKRLHAAIADAVAPFAVDYAKTYRPNMPTPDLTKIRLIQDLAFRCTKCDWRGPMSDTEGDPADIAVAKCPWCGADAKESDAEPVKVKTADPKEAE